MNKKDVIYIEPNDDITDILANIKKSENKIVALVPPKKAGVLRSIVNFKLIAKTAAKEEKAIVLVTTDESLIKLASTVKMPVAKNLQSKPKLPEGIEAAELGDKKTTELSEEEADEVTTEVEDEPVAPKKKERKTTVIDEAEEEAEASEAESAPAKAVVRKKDEVEGSDLSKSHKDSAKEKTAKSDEKEIKVPNMQKYTKFIVLGLILLVAVIGFTFWATAIAPAATIKVRVTATANNFSESIKFVDNENASDPDNGVFYAERKTIKKQASKDFEATGEVDKGIKATGSLQITRPVGETITANNANFSVPDGSHFYHNGKEYVVTKGGSINLSLGDNLSKNLKCTDTGSFFAPVRTCSLTAAVSSDRISIEAVASGEEYNVDEKTTTGWTSSVNIPANYTISVSAISGGLSKVVKQVSEDDVRNADETLTVANEVDIKNELKTDFSSDYVLIEASFAAGEAKITTSPSIGEEVGDDVKPKIIKEVEYSILAVNRDDLDRFITTKTNQKISGDATQRIFSTGVSKNATDNSAYIDGYKSESNSAKLKSTVKIGPMIDEETVAKEAYGKKVGAVRTKLDSINGVKSEISTSYFWVNSIPADENKVKIEISVE